MTIRQERIRDLLRTHLSSLLLTDITDPRLQDITVTDIRLDREIEYADIYVHALGDDEREDAVMEGFKRANGYIRSTLASRLRLKHMPVLHFHWDHTLANADYMDKLLDNVKKELDGDDAS